MSKHSLPAAHRFVTVHHCVSYYWLRSFLGHLVLLVRCSDFNAVSCIERLQNEVRHNAVVKGMLLMHALDDSVFLPEWFGAFSRLQIQVVVMLLSVMEGSPVPCVAEALKWLSRHPLVVQIARNKEMRPVMRMALLASRPAMKCVPLLGDTTVMRSMVRISRYIPVVLDCIMEEDGQQWTADAMNVLCKEKSFNIDPIIWRFLFSPEVTPAVLNIVLAEKRFCHRDWYVPLRMYWCNRDSRPAPRGAAPLLRLVCADILTNDELSEALEQIVFAEEPAMTTCTNRWWNAVARYDSTMSGRGSLAVKAWVLQRFRIFVQSLLLDKPSCKDPLSTRVQQRMVLLLNVNPCTTMLGECLWFLLHSGSPMALAGAAVQWVSEHRCSWVSVVRDATEGQGCTYEPGGGGTLAKVIK